MHTTEYIPDEDEIGAYVDNPVLPEGNVDAIQGESDGVNGCPAGAAPVFISGGNPKTARGVIAGLHHGVVAGTLEVVKFPIKGGVMWVTVDVARSGAGWITSPQAILNLADLIWTTRQLTARHDAISKTLTTARAVLRHNALSFLPRDTHKKCMNGCH